MKRFTRSSPAFGLFLIATTLASVLAVFAGLIYLWPVFPAALAGVYVFIKSRRSDRVLVRAVHAIAGPVTIGFGLVSGFLLLANVIPQAHDASLVNRAQGHLIDLSVFLQHAGLSARNSFLIFGASVILQYLLPRWPVVSGLACFRKRTHQAITTLMVATSFTFITATWGHREFNQACARIEARYRAASERARYAEATYLACQAIRASLPRLDTKTVLTLRAILGSVRVPDDGIVADVSFRQSGGGYASAAADDFAESGASELVGDWIASGKLPAKPPARRADVLSGTLEQRVYRLRQEERIAAADAKAADHEISAAEDSFASFLDLTEEPVREVADNLIASIVSGIARSIAGSYLDEVDSSLNRMLVEKFLSPAIQKLLSSPRWRNLAAHRPLLTAVAMKPPDLRLRTELHASIHLSESELASLLRGDVERGNWGMADDEAWIEVNKACMKALEHWHGTAVILRDMER